mmetsp:Transcript_22581/g.33018  ORF Transcript_22581/g.33018 Transcript_22581/m.33018 type:complete len:770 (-) Transcript_22581:183-2492(-)
MPRKNKRSRPVPCDLEERNNEALKSAKENAYNMLTYSLIRRGGLTEEYELLLSDLAEAIDLPLSYTPNQERIIFKKLDDDDESSSNGTKRRRSSRIQQSEDPHNEVCDVCDKGGDLLCCDSCSLVFHMACVRPTITDIPEGEWHCPYCIASKSISLEWSEEDITAARIALRRMRALRSAALYNSFSEDGADGEDIDGEPGMAEGELDSSLVVTRAGSRLVVKKTALGLGDDPAYGASMTEISRWWTLEEAFQDIRQLSDIPVKRKETDDSESEEDEALWCTYCIDDPAITLCCFCGCRACFGKHDSSYLLICDGCDVEFHTYCLNPPLEAIPEGAWYCSHCQATRPPEEIVPKAEEEEETPIEVPKRRGRGRPPGSSKQKLHHQAVTPKTHSFKKDIRSSVLAGQPNIVPSSMSHRHPLPMTLAATKGLVSDVVNMGMKTHGNASGTLECFIRWAPCDELRLLLADMTTHREELLTKMKELDPEAYEKLDFFKYGMKRTEESSLMSATTVKTEGGNAMEVSESVSAVEEEIKATDGVKRETCIEELDIVGADAVQKTQCKAGVADGKKEVELLDIAKAATSATKQTKKNTSVSSTSETDVADPGESVRPPRARGKGKCRSPSRNVENNRSKKASRRGGGASRESSDQSAARSSCASVTKTGDLDDPSLPDNNDSAVGNIRKPPSPHLQDFIRFSKLVSEQEANQQLPLASPLPTPADAQRNATIFNPEEGLLLSPGTSSVSRKGSTEILSELNSVSAATHIPSTSEIEE